MPFDREVFDKIYRDDVVPALENDRELDFLSITAKSFQKGKCPRCGKRELFISREKPFVEFTSRGACPWGQSAA